MQAQNSTHSKPLETCIRNRHSTRFYTEDPVPRETLNECIALAQLAPSNSNIQNWRITIASGKARDRCVAALKAETTKHGPNVPPLPERYQHFRSEFGHLLYGEKGYNIPRDEPEKLQEARLRNYSFFGAPVCAVITMDQELANVDAMCVGLFIQTFMLALTERGLGSCLQISVTGYPDVLREQFRIPNDQIILCGMAIGWPAPNNPVNELVNPRDELGQAATFLDE